jgi:NADPH-dependent ferric siderophore reductase
VVAARSLPSGDTLLIFEGEEAKQKWQEDKRITKAFGENARLCTREYTVIAHRVRVAIVNVQNQDAGIASIYAQNPTLKDSVTIVWIG